MYRILAVGLLSAFLVGCSAGDSLPYALETATTHPSAPAERVLHLRTGDYTERAYLAALRAGGLTVAGCRLYRGLNAESVADVIAQRFQREPDRSRVVQDSIWSDDVRAAELQIAECTRIGS